MNSAVWIMLIVIVFIIGFVIGMLISVRYSKKELKKKPPISRQQLAELMTEMGRKPSAQQLNSMMKHVKNEVRNK